ncbi:MAG TPA: (Fe-S)-binding protein [Thermodesulfovibrionales bacterium]|nr:(Fe-S)-binding protein [Thermodesulfovibrionales bacterium]
MAVQKPEELSKINYKPPKTSWMDTPTEIKKGIFCWGAKEKSLKVMGMPNVRAWSVADEDWKLPENWKEIFLEGLKERLSKYRSFQLFLDICVRCGACADKCHYFIGGGDPKNMPVLRAELLRSIYRKYFTTPGKILGKIAGGRELTYDVLRELWYYAYQCSECRRCSLFCPYGIDTAEITILVRELLNLLGLNIEWIAGPVANCWRTGNHMGLLPHTIADTLASVKEDIETVTGVKINYSLNRKGAEILYVIPSGEFFDPTGLYTLTGALMLFHEIGLDYTWSTFASEGGNFGLFTSNEVAKRLHSKIYAEAKRLKVKWIIGGECGHMWRVWHQYHNTWFGPVDYLEEPVSPLTGTKFENAKSNKIVHICEFTADLIKHGKINLDPKRNDNYIVTHHDSCNTSRGMGIFDEPRYIINNACNSFYEMPINTIREQTFCCGSGSGLNASENMELRLRGGLPRANAVKYVNEKFGVNRLSCICQIDRAVLQPLMDYWVPGVTVSGVHELVGNALIMKGEKERTTDLRGEPLPGKEAQ